MALIFAAAQGWNGGGSSGVAFASNCLLKAVLKVKPPAVPGNQTPERSGWPSALRGAGPPLGTDWGFDFAAPGSEAFPSCPSWAAAGVITKVRMQSTTPALIP